MNDVLHVARFVRKTHTASLVALESLVAGPLGQVHEGDVRVGLLPDPHPIICVTSQAATPLIPLDTIGLGDDGTALPAFMPRPVAGLVIEGTGGGHVRAGMASSLGELAERVPVVIASRTGIGEVLRKTYRTPGAEPDLASRGLLRAGHLDGLRARLLLALLLMSTRRYQARDCFAADCVAVIDRLDGIARPTGCIG